MSVCSLIIRIFTKKPFTKAQFLFYPVQHTEIHGASTLNTILEVPKSTVVAELTP